MAWAASLTNFILGAECLALSTLIFRTKTNSSLKIDFYLVFFGIALASFINCILQGIISEASSFYMILWKALLILVGLVSFFLLSASFRILMSEKRRHAEVISLITTLLYIMMVLKYPYYLLAIGYYYIAAVLFFIALNQSYRLVKHRQIKYGLYAFILISVAPLFEQSYLIMGHIAGNVIYNILMIFALYFCYIAIVALLRKHSAAGFCDVYVNDLHSRLNETVVANTHFPFAKENLQNVIKKAAEQHKIVSITGARHAMGGQQFAEKSLLLDMRHYDRLLDLNQESGIVRVQSGITWPKLLAMLQAHQAKSSNPWTFSQKQTGADKLTLGGALSANIHGRGLTLKPFVQDILSFKLINAEGELRHISRQENPQLFKLAIGGYGLFGVVSEIALQLVKREVVQRKVEVINITELPNKFRERIAAGFTFGDFQFKTNEKAPDYLKVGVFSCYKPVENAEPLTENRYLKSDDWNKLLLLGHIDKEAAFKRYADYYLTTEGQYYWSDNHQMSFYNDRYVEYIRSILPDFREGSLMITELYVPLDKIAEFMGNVAADLSLQEMNVVYGTARLIRKDDETFLPWAKEDYACIIFNLHVKHHASSFQFVGDYFTRLIDHALQLGGSFYLTYHRWARKDQILKAYPQFPEFLKLKLQYDENELFQSTWYQYYRKLFNDKI